jgi:hypothetical protein
MAILEASWYWAAWARKALLSDLGHIGRIVLGAGRSEHLAEELLAEARHLALEHLHAVMTPGVVQTERVEGLVGRIFQIE